MLPDEKNDLLYLLNILEYIGKIRKYTESIESVEELFELNEQMNLNASLTLLANIGENVSKITDCTKSGYPHIKWQQIKDFRNRIVHDYVGIDLAVVYEIITNDLVVLKIEIETIIKEKLNQKIFDMDEIKTCVGSEYYKHIEFENIM
jgi:uncharacterized protein with HEPN domain